MERMDPTREWFDDEEFWRVLAPFLFGTLRDGPATETEVTQLLELCQPPLAARVLDMPCGPGRHAVALAERGFAVTGVDRTAAYLEQARERARKQGVEVELVAADMRRFRREPSFDLALNLFTSFGYFRRPEEDLQVLGNFHAALLPSGTLVLEMHGKEQLCRDFRERDWHRLDEGAQEETYLLEERSLRDGWSWVEITWIVVRGGTTRRFTFGLRPYSGQELRTALLATGFRDVALYGSLAGTPYDAEADRLVAVARK